MDAKEILKRLKESTYTVDDFVWNCGVKVGDTNLFYLDKIGVREIVERTDTDEYSGQIFVVSYFPDYDVYIRTEGRYTSHVGSDWDNGFGEEVKPKEVKVTAWEKI